MALRRLKKEYNDLMKNSGSTNISAGPIKTKKFDSELNIVEVEDFFHWKGTIIGPLDTPYEGGVFELDIVFSTEYPFKPPSIKFITKIYHPNINSAGSICISNLKGDWSPSLTIETVLLSISSLMDDPNPDDPLDVEIADVYINDVQKFNSIAKQYTMEYANF